MRLPGPPARPPSRSPSPCSRRADGAVLPRFAAARSFTPPLWGGYPRSGYSQPVPDHRLSLGEIIRRQRELNALSMRQFAEMVGISNPYLSQIERGLREPSEHVLDAIARSLETSVGSLYEQAGRPIDDGEPAVVEAIRMDPALSRRQRQALIQVYEAFAAQGPARRPSRRRRTANATDDDDD